MKNPPILLNASGDFFLFCPIEKKGYRTLELQELFHNNFLNDYAGIGVNFNNVVSGT